MRKVNARSQVLKKFAVDLNENVLTHGVNLRASDDKKRLSKWYDQGWKMVLHTVTSSLQFLMIYKKTIIDRFAGVWRPCLIEQTPPRSPTLAYRFELAGYTFTVFHHRFFTVRRKENYRTFGYDITTCVLVLFSYLARFYRVGFV
jgi:hypothetical protein